VVFYTSYTAPAVVSDIIVDGFRWHRIEQLNEYTRYDYHDAYDGHVFDDRLKDPVYLSAF